MSQRFSKDFLRDTEKLFKEGVLNEFSWKIELYYGEDSDFEDYGDEQFMLFPSAADLLMWLRFWALPFVSRAPGAVGMAAAGMTEIDNAPVGAKAEELVWRLFEMVAGDHGQLYLGGEMSVHRWLTEEGSLEEFRQAFGTPNIVVVGGRWYMGHETWEAIWARFMENHRTGLSLPPLREPGAVGTPDERSGTTPLPS
jgi:hypothetical protein